MKRLCGFIATILFLTSAAIALTVSPGAADGCSTNSKGVGQV